MKEIAGSCISVRVAALQGVRERECRALHIIAGGSEAGPSVQECNTAVHLHIFKSVTALTLHNWRYNQRITINLEG